VLPYLRDLLPDRRPVAPGPDRARSGVVAAAVEVFGPTLRGFADLVGRGLGGSADVRRRLGRAGSTLTVDELRVEQVLWGLVAALLTTGVGLLAVLRGSVSPLPLLVAVAAAFALGVMARDQQLSAQLRARERLVLLEFPAVADLLALAVAAGEGPVAALDRVCRVAHGHLAGELEIVLGEVRTGTPVTVALDRLAARTGVTVVARFAAALAVAIERGTPLVDVLHAQAADVREAGRRALVETGARKEVLMMVPVVFLVLPVTVVFAFYPGVVGLQLTTP
jgi:tight adherence protein C